MPSADSIVPNLDVERGAWQRVGTGWRQVFGSFAERGVSIESHDFRVAESLDWGRSFHEESVELCLNLEGRGSIGAGRSKTVLRAGTAAAYWVGGGEPLPAYRAAGERHHFVTVEFSREYLASSAEGCAQSLEPALRRGLRRDAITHGVAPLRMLNPTQQALVASICTPPVTPAALPLWYESKVLECIAAFLFPAGEELFCTRQKRVAEERVARVVTALQEALAEPPTLEELGRKVGVSPFYLSRIFSQEMQMTIPQYLRRIRMEKAAELLRAGRHNVTEAAFAVGYSSLGYFSKSFCEVIGCCPALYPSARKLAVPRSRSMPARAVQSSDRE